MKKLKVTWLSAAQVWNKGEADPATETAELAMGAKPGIIGETLVFQDSSGRTLLVIPQDRLISAVQVEGETAE